MKINIKTSLLIALVTYCGTQMHSQVGIGVATPDPATILDLSNTGNKGVLIPIANVSPSTLTTAPQAMFIYYQNGIYVKESGGFNAINPWKYKYNGNTSEDISFNPASMVGVGIGINTGGILGHLHISDTLSTGAVKQVAASGNSAALFIGSTTSNSHMIFDADEIMVKSTATTGGLLKLQEEDGSLQIGNDRVENVDTAVIYLNTKIGTSARNKKLTVEGNIDAKDKIQEKGNDLLPTGSVIMWYGTTIPPGWALCDGTNGTPNLSSKVIRASGTGYVKNTTGGSDTRAIVTANLPNHTHTGSTTPGEGLHDHNDNENARADNDDNDGVGNYIGGRGGSWNNDGGNGHIRPGGSDHVHTLTTTGCTGCSGTAIDVRDAYYVMEYIMKL